MTVYLTGECVLQNLTPKIFQRPIVGHRNNLRIITEKDVGVLVQTHVEISRLFKNCSTSIC